ncbi:hypothetical protein V5O48_018723, partial [Marasmius crinis-equi]
MKIPLTEGGKNMLDLIARNEAIVIMWLKSYLNFGSERPTWAYFADSIIAEHILNYGVEVDESARMNAFLQSWKTSVTKLPADLKSMMKTATKYGLQMEGLAFSREIIGSMPIWLHKHADPKLRRLCNSPQGHCMRGKHRISTVHETEILARKLRSVHHKRRKNCACSLCKRTRESVRCENPHKCYEYAERILSFLPEKWNPLKLQPADIELESLSQGEEGETQQFDDRITTRGTLADAFRIFTEGELTNSLPPLVKNDDNNSEWGVVYCAGASINKNDENAQTAAATWHGDEHAALNEQLKIPASLSKSIHGSQVIAIKAAAEGANEIEPITIRSQSRFAIDALTKNMTDDEDRGYIDVNHGNVIKATVARLRERKARSFLTLVQNKDRTVDDERASVKAEEAIYRTDDDEIDLDIPLQYRITGVKLKTITQKLATKAIKINNQRIIRKKKSSLLNRRNTVCNLDRARYAAQSITGRIPTNEAIWKGIKCKDFAIKTRYFMWMTMHDAYKVGEYWEGKENMEHRGTCSKCGVTENMEHILFECEATGQNEVWSIAQRLWNERHNAPEWKEPTLG